MQGKLVGRIGYTSTADCSTDSINEIPACRERLNKKRFRVSTGIPHFEIPFTNDSIHLFVIHAEVQLVNSATVADYLAMGSFLFISTTCTLTLHRGKRAHWCLYCHRCAGLHCHFQITGFPERRCPRCHVAIVRKFAYRK